MGIEDTLHRMLVAENTKDLDKFVSQYASDALHTHPFPEPIRGREGIRKEAEDFFKAFPDMEFKFTALISKSDSAAAEIVMTGTHTGTVQIESEAVPPTNKRIEWKVAVFWRFNSQGLIQEEHYYFDPSEAIELFPPLKGT